MLEEIEKALLRLEIEGKETRKRMVRNILIYCALVVIFYFIPRLFPQLPQALFAIDAIIGLFGGLYVVFEAIPTLYHPLESAYYAFKDIIKAIEILEKSDEAIAYEEAYRCVKHASKILHTRILKLDEFEWFDRVIKILQQFHENLELIVLPAISNASIKKEDLEEIALAVYSVNPSEIEVVNKKLEKSYEKSEPPPRKVEIIKGIFLESVIGKLLYSLALGYGLVLGISLVYVVATSQDFVIFARENPEVVVLGGLIVSGITFWRTKPQSQWKSA